jgi:hypothetical protein
LKKIVDCADELFGEIPMSSAVGNSLSGVESVNPLIAQQLCLNEPEMPAKRSLLEAQDWEAIATLALEGWAPAQYIVGASFEKRGDLERAREWYQRGATQGYSPALSKLEQLKFAAAPAGSSAQSAPGGRFQPLRRWLAHLPGIPR